MANRILNLPVGCSLNVYANYRVTDVERPVEQHLQSFVTSSVLTFIGSVLPKSQNMAFGQSLSCPQAGKAIQLKAQPESQWTEDKSAQSTWTKFNYRLKTKVENRRQSSRAIFRGGGKERGRIIQLSRQGFNQFPTVVQGPRKPYEGVGLRQSVNVVQANGD